MGGLFIMEVKMKQKPIEKTIEYLQSQKKQFPPAYYLMQALEKFGFFNGEVYQTPTGKWKLTPYEDMEIRVYFERNPLYPRFGAYRDDEENIWRCALNHNGKTKVFTFSTNNGEFLEGIIYKEV